MSFYHNKIYLICLLVICWGICLLFNSCTYYHPFPKVDELYEARDPDTNEPVIHIVATKWTDGHYSTPIVKIVDSNDCTWAIGCYSENPELWSIMRICKGEKKEVRFRKIYTTRSRPTWLPYSEFGDYKK